MKVLLTGGTGFVGTAIRKQLVEGGHDVRLLVRPKSIHKLDDADRYDVVAGDVLDSHACLRAVEGMEALVHLVGIRREYPQMGTTYESLHTEATFNIFDAAKRAGVRRAILMSGLGTRENAASRYHSTKWEMEEIVRGTGMRWTIFRPSIIFGRGDEFHPLLADLVLRTVVPLVDGGKALLQPVALENVVEAMTRSITMPETQGRIIEVGGPERVSFVDVLGFVARHYEVWPNSIKVSSRVMKPMVKMLQRFQSFPLTYDELLMMIEDNICDTEDFTSTFGITLKPYRENLPQILGAKDLVTA